MTNPDPINRPGQSKRFVAPQREMNDVEQEAPPAMRWDVKISVGEQSEECKVYASGRVPKSPHIAVITNLEMQQMSDPIAASNVAFIVQRQADVFPLLQALVDTCWEAGIRPSQLPRPQIIGAG